MALQCKKCGTFAARGEGIPTKCSGCGQTDPAEYQRVEDPFPTGKQMRQHLKDKAFLEGRAMRALPAFKHAKDNDDEILHQMFAGHTSIEILQEIAARMANDENQETIKAANEIGLTLAFDPAWKEPQAFTYWHRVEWHSKNNGGNRYVKGQLVGMDRKMEEVNTIILQPKKKGFKLVTIARFQYLGRLPRDATYEEVDQKFGVVGCS